MHKQNKTEQKSGRINGDLNRMRSNYYAMYIVYVLCLKQLKVNHRVTRL